MQIGQILIRRIDHAMCEDFGFRVKGQVALSRSALSNAMGRMGDRRLVRILDCPEDSRGDLLFEIFASNLKGNRRALNSLVAKLIKELETIESADVQYLSSPCGLCALCGQRGR